MSHCISPYSYPEGIFVEGATEATTASPAANAGDDDFFEEFDKPSSSVKPGAPSRPAAAPVAPRTITSSSIRSTSSIGSSAVRAPRLGFGASRLSSTASINSSASASPTSSSISGNTTLGSGSGSNTGSKRLGGLKATKVKTNDFDFEKAAREAAAEEERIKQLGYDRQREEEEEARARKAAEAAKASSATNKSAPAPDTTNSPKPNISTNKFASAPKGSSQDVARLGMGMKRLGFGATGSATPSAQSSKTVETDETTFAREKFGAQKAISSDMYFGRNAYDPTAISEAQTRLQACQGATAISSAQYFGRDEEEERAMLGSSNDGGLLGDGSLANIEAAAKDAVARVMSNPDVQQVGENIRAGALKVSRPPILSPYCISLTSSSLDLF